MTLGAGGIATEDEIDFDTFAGCVRGDLGTDAVLEHLPDLAVWATKATKINRLPTRRGASTALRHKSIRHSDVLLLVRGEGGGRSIAD